MGRNWLSNRWWQLPGRGGGALTLGLGGTVWVGESGTSLGDITPLVIRLEVWKNNKTVFWTSLVILQ